MATVKSRNSSIELLKVVGIFMIVLAHIIKTLAIPNPIVCNQECFIVNSHATHDMTVLGLSMMQYLGSMGNMIFFICSSWFLLESNKVNWKKVLKIVMDVWFVSVIMLAIILLIGNVDIDKDTIRRQFFPTFYANSWYVTCYLLFYAAHPLINGAIKSLKQREFLGATLACAFLYILVCFYHTHFFYTSFLILWAVIYSIVAYFKLYLPRLTSNDKFNVALVVIGFIGTFGLVVATNYLGLHIGFFSNKLQKWNSQTNPFILMMVIGLVFLARNHTFTNRTVNYISGLSLLVYIIHDNMLIRDYYRPRILEYIYCNLGYSHVILWMLILAIITLALGIICSIVYKASIGKISSIIAEKIYCLSSYCWNKLSVAIMKLN